MFMECVEKDGQQVRRFQLIAAGLSH